MTEPAWNPIYFLKLCEDMLTGSLYLNQLSRTVWFLGFSVVSNTDCICCQTADMLKCIKILTQSNFLILYNISRDSNTV